MIMGKLILQKHLRVTTGSYLHLYTGKWPEATLWTYALIDDNLKFSFIICNIEIKIDDKLVFISDR